MATRVPASPLDAARKTRVMRRALAAIVVAVVCAAPAVARAQLQLDGDFENGSLSGWHASGNDTAEIVDAPVRAGNAAVHLHLDPTDPDAKRTEITAGTNGELQYDQEYWIGFSFNVTRWDTPFPTWATLFQFHAVPGNENWDCCAGRNPFTVTVMNGQLGAAVIESAFSGNCGAIADSVWSDSLELSRWYDWVVRLKPSLTDGIIEVWLDGELLYSATGGNVDPVDVCAVDQEPWTYLKIGVYKEYTNTATEDVYFDEVRIYKGTDGYDIVQPGGAEPGPVDAGAPADAPAADGSVDAGSPDAAPGGLVDATSDDGPGAGAADQAQLNGGCGCDQGRSRTGGRYGLLLLLASIWLSTRRRATRRPPIA